MIESGDLKNRAVTDPRGVDAVDADIRRIKGRKSEPDPFAISTEELSARLRAARAVPLLPGPYLHCGHCFGEGRDAAIRALETPANGA